MFIIRYICQDLIPVSLKLKTTIKIIELGKLSIRLKRIVERMPQNNQQYHWTCWIKLEVLKQSKIILKSLTSFRWHPYWSYFIRSLRNVRLNKINERTYQDGTGVGLVVDKERGVFRIHVCTYHREKELVCPHFGVSGRGVEVVGGWGRGESVGG